MSENDIWKTEVKNGVTVKTCDLNDIGKIEFKSKLTPTSEEKLEKALEWIDGHKKKSVKHDEILKLLTYAISFCLAMCVMTFFVAIALGKLIEIFSWFGGLPIGIAALFVYTVIKKIGAASKE